MRKGSRLRRRSVGKSPKKKFYVITEGKNTEPDYVRSLSRAHPESLVEIEIIPAAGVPETILKKAKEKRRFNSRKRDSYRDGDQVWVMFDRDEHPNVDKVLRECRDSGIGAAHSNPCFELWLILHFEDFEKCVGRADVIKHCESVCPGYSRVSGKRFDPGATIEHVQEAEVRAEKQLEERKRQGGMLSPPFTTVFEFTKAFRGK